MDAKFREEDKFPGEISNLMSELYFDKNYSEDSKNSVFILHPSINAISNRSNPQPWGKNSFYGESSVSDSLPDYPNHEYGAVLLSPFYEGYNSYLDDLQRLLGLYLQYNFEDNSESSMREDNRIINTKSSLSTREKTYRLMLADLLAFCETTVPEDGVISHLDLVVASRTIHGQLQTNLSQINEEIINSLPISLEVDLATKGMVDLIGKHIKVTMDYANNSWGLVCADFLANLNYHNQQVHEKQFLEKLEKQGRYSVFESFGDFDVRRANISERDQDYVLALYRWLLIAYKQSDSTRAKDAIQGLLGKLFYKRGTSGYVVSFEAVIERLWRNYNTPDKYHELLGILNLLEEGLINFIELNHEYGKVNFLFRLRNLMLIVENHLSRTDNAKVIAHKQNIDLSKLVSNPEYFQMVLDFKINEIEIYVNALELDRALSLAKQYAKLISNYKEVWQLLLEKHELNDFEGSRANIKSEMVLLRCNALCIGINNYAVADDFLDRFTSVAGLLSHEMDISRLNNYKVLLLLKQYRHKEAISQFIDKYSVNNDLKFSIFDFLWFLRAVNDALLSKKSIEINAIKSIVNGHLDYFDFNTKGHPYDLVLRELALLEYHFKDKSKALKNLRKSRNAFNLGDSVLSSWLIEVTNIHEDYINGKIKKANQYFQLLPSNTLVKSVFESNSKVSFFEKVRYFSPY